MKSNYKFGTTFGIFLEWLNHPALHLVSEIYYIQKGMNEISDLTSPNGEIIETYTYKHHVDYISFPITLKLQTGLRHNLLYIKAGPRMDLKIGHKTQYMELIYKEFEYMVFGTDICAGIEREIESGISFLLELCYNHDFKKAYKTSVIKIKNRSFSLVCGLKL